jgi:hypothetical protein
MRGHPIDISDIIPLLTRCTNLKTIVIEECFFSTACDLVERLDENEIVCNLESLKLFYDSKILDENLSPASALESIKSGVAITELDRIFSSRSPEFTMKNELCVCGGILQYPYNLEFKDVAECAICSSILPTGAECATRDANLIFVPVVQQ